MATQTAAPAQDNNPQATATANASYAQANPNTFSGSSTNPATPPAQDAQATTPLPTPTNQPTTTPAQQALTTAQASGNPPQTQGAATTAMQQFAPAQPTFYKPTTAVANPSGGNYDPATVFDANGKPLSYDQFIAAGGKSDFSNVTAGNIPKSTTPPPTTTGPADTGINNLLKSSAVDQQLAQDPGWQKIQQAVADANSATSQKQTLVQQYSDLLNQYNVPAINTELINDKKIIDGTEDDIRHEVTAAGGFASDSQVQALSVARNKSLIANYNTLQQQKTDALNTVNTMINLAGQDRQFAQTTALQNLNIAMQEADYQQKFIANAQEGYKAVISAVGYSGLFNALQASGDPNSISLAEQTLGLNPGMLQQIASIPDPNAQAAAVDLALKKTQLQQSQVNLQQSAAEEPLKVKQLQAQINSSNASAASSAASTAKTKAETDFMNTHDGMTQSEYNAQQQKQADAENTQIQKFQADAATFITQLDAGKVTWGAAWNALHAQYPDASTESIDNALDATNYRNSAHGG